MSPAVAVAALVGLSAVAAAGALAPVCRRSSVPALPVEREPSSRDARRRPRPTRLPAWVAWTLLVAAASAAIVPNLASALRPRPPTASLAGSAAGMRESSSLADLRAAVLARPTDVSSRLALADRLLAMRRLSAASDQYVAVLRIDPSDAHARASLGMVLYLSGRPADGLRAVRSAIRADPAYERARLFEGVILLRGLHRPRAAIAALRRFVRAAPDAPEVPIARTLIAGIRRTTAR